MDERVPHRADEGARAAGLHARDGNDRGRLAGRRGCRRVRPLQRRCVGLRARDRLLVEPVFVLCTLRSGSTLLRVVLDSHSRLHAPHETHLRYISVQLDQKWSERSMKAMGLDARVLEYLLWDRLLDHGLARSGKPTLVEKT